MLALALAAAVVPPLYRLAVAVQIRRIFAALSRGDFGPAVGGLADDFTYHFHGETSISGVRRRRESVTAWFERVYRLLPDARFDADDVMVAGPPWKTRVAVHARIGGHLADGTPYSNTFKQRIVIRYGRVTSIETIEDTQRLERAMQALAANGVEEAVAAPIED